MLTPLQVYKQKIADGALQQDSAQYAVVKQLQTIFKQLLKRHKQRNSRYGLLRRRIKPRKAVKGLYLWGNVGTGKTELMDLFYDQLNVNKMRIHFFQFMQDLHEKLKQVQGHKNPLELIGRQLADQYLVICFDEFFVNNIADAMLLGELFTAMFEGGLCLITSSNFPPDALYKDGIQRERFLPAIQTIKDNTTVMNLDAGKDYRKQHVEQAGVYFTPLDEHAEHEIQHSFLHYSSYKPASTDPIELFERPVKIIKRADKIIWFDFKDLCSKPRSQKDYLELARQYDTFLVSNISVIPAHDRDTITLFIALIDILYDKHKRLIVSAATDSTALYPEGALEFEYARTNSRLVEMQSEDYLSGFSNH
ncbi:MAG: AFG1 family ATPase [Gammaproteobacteria bacterium]|nr:AFG1 family ATPase [Gammaproteobacteria bacterium]MCH9744794.1 AFG1 family ATPase [Gammaproteobacteria bacterium]